MLNVGGWLTHGDLALEAGVDFLAEAEHRLVPARVRSEWNRFSLGPYISGPLSAFVGVVSLKGAPLSLPTIATAGFRTFFLLLV